jgi:hypothetical protein
MTTKHVSTARTRVSAQPRLHQKASPIQEYGTVNFVLPLELEEPVRLEVTEQLNQLLADTMTLRDLYKKAPWQVTGPTFYRSTNFISCSISISASKRNLWMRSQRGSKCWWCQYCYGA